MELEDDLGIKAALYTGELEVGFRLWEKDEGSRMFQKGRRVCVDDD